MKIFYIFIIGYIFGSIPSGYIFGKIKGRDITKEGTGKIGTANIYKLFGFIPAVIVFFCDFLKGIIPMVILKIAHIPDTTTAIAGFGAIIGHNWPIWLKFKGEGRGVITSWGVLYYFLPRETLIIFAALIFIGLLIKLKGTPLPIFIMFLLIPIISIIFHEPLWMILVSIGVFILFVVRRIIGGIHQIKISRNKRKEILHIALFDSPTQ